MAEESPPISPGSGRVSPALSSTSGSENEMDEDWNFVQLSAGGQVSAGGSETPMTNSSCEFVRVAGDGATYHRSDNASDTSDGEFEFDEMYLFRVCTSLTLLQSPDFFFQ